MGATVRRPPFLTQLNIPLSLAHRHRPRLNLSRDCAADIYGSVGFGKKKFQLMFLLPSEHDAPQPALADFITFFPPSSSSSHFPLFAHRTQSRSFCTLRHLSLEIFFFLFLEWEIFFASHRTMPGFCYHHTFPVSGTGFTSRMRDSSVSETAEARRRGVVNQSPLLVTG